MSGRAGDSKLKRRAAGAVRAGASRLRRYPWLVRSGVYLGRLSVQLGRKLVRDECLDRAASLAYTTVLALVPLLAVSFLVFRMSSAFTGAEDAVRSYLFRSLIADSVGKAVEYLNAFLNRVSAGAVGITGLALLIFSATWLFITVESTLNHIFRVREQRRLWARFTTFWSLLTLGPVIIAVGIYLTSRFNASAVGRFLQSTPWLGAVIGLLVPLLISVLVLTLMYKLVPNTKVRLVPALVGGLVGALLFHLSKGAFDLYVTQIYSGSYTTKVYGTFALFPIFLLWIYIAWLVVLLGAVVTYTVQYLDVIYDEELERRVSEDQERAAPSPYYACLVMLVIAYRQWADKPPPSQLALMRALRIPEPVVYEVLRRLDSGGLLRATHEQQDEVVYQPARDIGRISVDQTIRAYQSAALGVAEHAADAASQALDDLFCDLAVAQHQVGGEISFRDLVEAVDERRFESMFTRGHRATAPEDELKPPPTPLSRAAKTVDPEANSIPPKVKSEDPDVEQG